MNRFGLVGCHRHPDERINLVGFVEQLLPVREQFVQTRAGSTAILGIEAAACFCSANAALDSTHCFRMGLSRPPPSAGAWGGRCMGVRVAMSRRPCSQNRNPATWLMGCGVSGNTSRKYVAKNGFRRHLAHRYVPAGWASQAFPRPLREFLRWS